MLLLEQISLQGLLDHLNKEIFLPSIQREYKWDEERIEKFFDSLVKRLPTGLVLLYSHNGKFDFPGRKFFEKFNKEAHHEQYKFDMEIEKGQILVLDGQQRLQSLMIGTRGSYNGYYLYHDILWKKTKGEDIHKCTFDFKRERGPYFRDNNSLFVKVPTLIKIAEKCVSIGPLSWEEKKSKFQEILKEIGINELSESEYEEMLNYILLDIRPLFFDVGVFSNVLKLQLIEGKNINQLLEVFVRFNSGGLRLEKSDLLFSLLKTQWKDIAEEMAGLSDKVYLPKDLLLKALIIMAGYKANEDIYEVSKDTEKLKEIFNDFKDTILDYFYPRLGQLTPQPDRVLRKFNFLIPVVKYLFINRKILHTKPLTELPGVVEYILIIAYNSNLRSDNYLNKLLDLIPTESNGKFPINELKAEMTNLGVKVEIDEDSLNSEPKLTFSLIQKGKWNPYKNRLHIEHIFPKSRIELLSEDTQPFIDTIWNKYIVFDTNNLSKGITLPEEYFTGSKEVLIKEYILPRDKSLLKTENFKKCLKWRQNKIKELFKENTEVNLVVKVPII